MQQTNIGLYLRKFIDYLVVFLTHFDYENCFKTYTTLFCLQISIDELLYWLEKSSCNLMDTTFTAEYITFTSHELNVSFYLIIYLKTFTYLTRVILKML